MKLPRILFLFVATVFYLLVVNPPREEYLNYAMLKPREMKGFVASEQPTDMLLPQSGWESDLTSETLLITTESVRLQSRRIGLDLLAAGGSKGVIELTTTAQEGGETDHQVLPFQFFPYDLGPTLKQIFINLPNSLVGKEVWFSIKLENFVTPKNSFAIRDRLEFFKSSDDLGWRFMVSNNQTLRFLSMFLLGIAFWLNLKGLIKRSEPIGKLELIALLVLFAAVAWRSSVFFYWDEWHAVNRFLLEGIAAVRYTHNEHFLPVFWMIYYAQILLFGACYQGYILISFMVHILNAFLLFYVLRELCPLDSERSAMWTNVRAALVLFYVANPLHVEVLQWSFVQCVLLEQLSLLLGILCLMRFLKAGRLLYLVGVTVACLLAPLLFGNGFAFAFILPIVGVGFIALLSENGWKFGDLFGKTIAKRGVLLFVMLCVSLGFCAYLYTANKEGFGHTLDARINTFKPWEYKKAVVRYLAVGTQFGGVLRGFAAFPTLTPYASHNLEKYLPINGEKSELILAVCGTIFSLGLLAFIWVSGAKERRTAALLWILGQGLILANMFLPALGRFNFGVIQSLALRYQSSSVLGLVLIAYGLLLVAKSCQSDPDALVWMWRKVISLSLLTWCMLAVLMWTRYDEWSGKGAMNYTFLEKQRAWKVERGSHRVPGERRWSEAPTFPTHLTPGFWPKDLVEILDKADARALLFREDGREPLLSPVQK